MAKVHCQFVDSIMMKKWLGTSRIIDVCLISHVFDHRGTPNHPARTCTLEYKEGAICWGTVYCVRGDEQKERLAMAYLENRECEYDEKTSVDFFKGRLMGLL